MRGKRLDANSKGLSRLDNRKASTNLRSSRLCTPDSRGGEREQPGAGKTPEGGSNIHNMIPWECVRIVEGRGPRPFNWTRIYRQEE
ncbi:MAG: hypothetical protein ACI8X5_001383 [Planctomycetota bacterium]|jgi:hypothetical protein